MGKEGKYDLKLAGPPPVPESSEEEEEDMKGEFVVLETRRNRLFANLLFVFGMRY